MTAFVACAIVPTYDNPQTVERVVDVVREHLDVVIVVDDGSHAPAAQVLDAVGQKPGVILVRHAENRGKGAAMKTGLARAAEEGFTHVLQVDADGQHNLDDIPRFLECAQKNPTALLLGAPQFDETRPAIRGFGHWFTGLWTKIEVAGSDIEDPQCGFRVYPVEAARKAKVRGDRMEYDLEIAVRMCWGGSPIINLPTKVRYLEASEGGVSHFHMGRDNMLISWMHTRLVTTAIFRWLTWPFRRLAKAVS